MEGGVGEGGWDKKKKKKGGRGRKECLELPVGVGGRSDVKNVVEW